MQSSRTYILVLLVFATWGCSLSGASLQVGWGGHNQLNTLRTIENGMVLFDGVEIDVRATKDGVVIGLHDARLDRETTGSGYISDVNWADLAGVTTLLGDPLATLVEMLAAVEANDGFVILDVRDVPAELVRRALDDAEFAYHFTIIFVFDHVQGASYIEAIPGAQVFFKTSALPSTLGDDAFLQDLVERGYGGIAFPTWTEFPSREVVEKMKNYGLFTASFVASSQADADQSSAIGIDYVVSNGNVYHFEPDPPASVEVMEWTVDPESVSFVVTVPRLFRRLFIEEYHCGVGSISPGWSMADTMTLSRLSPNNYRAEASVNGRRSGLYRVRLIGGK